MARLVSSGQLRRGLPSYTRLVPASNVFPQIKRSRLLSEDTPLGDDADAWNTMLAQDSKADPYEDVVFSHTEKERERGWVTGYFSKRHMDSKFGKGGWKAIRRRCIWSETAQKFRMIDNARTSRHNEAATTLETTVHCDVAVTKAVYARRSAQRFLTGEYQDGPAAPRHRGPSRCLCLPQHPEP